MQDYLCNYNYGTGSSSCGAHNEDDHGNSYNMYTPINKNPTIRRTNGRSEQYNVTYIKSNNDSIDKDHDNEAHADGDGDNKNKANHHNDRNANHYNDNDNDVLS